jgi:hypothetical protein
VSFLDHFFIGLSLLELSKRSDYLPLEILDVSEFLPAVTSLPFVNRRVPPEVNGDYRARYAAGGSRIKL